MSFPILTAILLCPVVGLLLIIATPGHRKRAIRWIALAAAAASAGLSLVLYVSYDLAGQNYQFVEKVPWVEELGIDYHLGVNGFSAPLVLLTGIVIFTGILTMWELQTRIKEFFAFMMLLVTGVFGVFMSLDMFFFFFFYEVAVLPMYPLIVVWGSTRKEYGAMKLTLYLLVGSALVIPALLAIYWEGGGTFNLMTLEQAGLSEGFQILWFPFVFIGFGVLGGLWPFHTWSPVGHVAAPHAVSMLHAGVLMKLGAFGVFRIGIMLMPEGAAFWCPSFIVLATFNIVYGAFVALKQTDLKFVIGYSSVSHMGIVLLGMCTLSTDGINGAAFQMFAHGIMTALFFSSVGYIYDRTHTRQVPELGGISTIMPRAATFFIVAALCGAGVPGFASFWAELLVFIAAFKYNVLIGVLTIGGLVLTALYALRVIQRAFYGEPNPKFLKLKDVPHRLALPRYVLVGTLLLFGFFPRLMLDMIDKANVALHETILSPDGAEEPIGGALGALGDLGERGQIGEQRLDWTRWLPHVSETASAPMGRAAWPADPPVSKGAADAATPRSRRRSRSRPTAHGPRPTNADTLGRSGYRAHQVAPFRGPRSATLRSGPGEGGRRTETATRRWAEAHLLPEGEVSHAR